MPRGELMNLPGTVHFGVFGSRHYPNITVVSRKIGVATIVCRWCVGEGEGPVA